MASVVARWFLGTSATKITLANATDVSAIGPFSVTAWIYQLGGSCLIGDITTNSGLQVQPGANINLVKQAVANIGSSIPLAGASASSGYGTFWKHIGVTYQNTGAFAFYLNGQPWGSGTSASTFANDPDTYLIGANQNPEFFYGAISDLAWFKGVLTPAEAWMLGTGRARPLNLRQGSSNYVGYWPLDGRTGFGTENDYSGNNNTGTVTGASLYPDPPQFVLNQRSYGGTVLNPFRWATSFQPDQSLVRVTGWVTNEM